MSEYQRGAFTGELCSIFGFGFFFKWKKEKSFLLTTPPKHLDLDSDPDPSPLAKTEVGSRSLSKLKESTSLKKNPG